MTNEVYAYKIRRSNGERSMNCILVQIKTQNMYLMNRAAVSHIQSSVDDKDAMENVDM